MEAPVVVRRAIQFLWAGLLIAVVESVANVAPMHDEGSAFVVVMLVLFGGMFGLNALLIYFASRRRNWARVVLTLFIASGLVLLAVFWREMDYEQWWSWIPTVGEYLLEVSAVVMLFSASATNWYRSRVPA